MTPKTGMGLLRQYTDDPDFRDPYKIHIGQVLSNILGICTEIGIQHPVITSALELHESDFNYKKFMKRINGLANSQNNRRIWKEITQSNEFVTIGHLDLKNKKKEAFFAHVGVPELFSPETFFTKADKKVKRKYGETKKEHDFFPDMLRTAEIIAYAKINLNHNPEIQDIMFHEIFEKINPDDDSDKYKVVKAFYEKIIPILEAASLKSFSQNPKNQIYFWNKDNLTQIIQNILSPKEVPITNAELAMFEMFSLLNYEEEKIKAEEEKSKIRYINRSSIVTAAESFVNPRDNADMNVALTKLTEGYGIAV